MKTIGLIGGMSWESTIPYYSIINEAVKAKLGGLHSARLVLYSVEFDELEKCMSAGEWDRIAQVLGDAAVKLQNAGAELILICTNTMHKLYDRIREHVTVPVLHIADAAADALRAGGVEKVALLGTRYTMKQDFYRTRLAGKGLEVIIPNDDDVEIVNRIIFDELCRGEIREESRNEYSRVIDVLKAQGAQAVLFGCTEIGLLVDQASSSLPVYDTTVLHAEAAAKAALE